MMKGMLKREDKRWKENEMMKGMMKGEYERRIRWWKEFKKEKIKGEWDDERNFERRSWNKNELMKGMMKAEDERRIRWWWEKKVDIQPWQAQGLKKGPRIKEFVRFNTKDPAPPSSPSPLPTLPCIPHEMLTTTRSTVSCKHI